VQPARFNRRSAYPNSGRWSASPVKAGQIGLLSNYLSEAIRRRSRCGLVRGSPVLRLAFFTGLRATRRAANRQGFLTVLPSLRHNATLLTRKMVNSDQSSSLI
jgi:hypothetical protein